MTFMRACSGKVTYNNTDIEQEVIANYMKLNQDFIN